jgi:molybdate transport system substrate-binding protein
MRRLVGGLAVALALGGCTGGGGDPRDLVVFAAASLTEAFGEIGALFEDRHPRVTVRFNFGPSDGLATQIREGGPADVFASANQRWMDAVADGRVLDRAVFARNRLAVVVPRDNPGGVQGIEDLGEPGVRLVMAAPDVPAGDYGRQVLDNAGILEPAEANVVSNEVDVNGVVQKVALGEADAGIVYVTDVTERVAPDVRAIPIPEDVNVVAAYPIAVLRTSAAPDLAREFVGFVLGDGQAVLRRAGFLPPA